MTDKEFAALRAKIKRIADRWCDALGLTAWNIRYIYHRDDWIQDGAGFVSAMRCHCDWQYMLCTLHFNMPELAEMDDAELTECVVHEYLHAILDELRFWTPGSHNDGHMEHTVVHLAKAFRWVYTMGASDGKKAKA